MEIIIGRDQQTRQLNIVKDGIAKNYGQPGSVPMDVSRHHISLQLTSGGKWKVKNLWSLTKEPFISFITCKTCAVDS